MSASGFNRIAKELISCIRVAFRDYAVPDTNSNLTLHSSTYPEYEGNKLAAFLDGKTWEALHWDEINEKYECDPIGSISFLTAEGFRYFLPGYASMALESFSDGGLSDALCLALTPSAGQPSSGKDFFAIRPGLSKDQCVVIIRSISFFAEVEKSHGLDDGPAMELIRVLQPDTS